MRLVKSKKKKKKKNRKPSWSIAWMLQRGWTWPFFISTSWEVFSSAALTKKYRWQIQSDEASHVQTKKQKKNGKQGNTKVEGFCTRNKCVKCSWGFGGGRTVSSPVGLGQGWWWSHGSAYPRKLKRQPKYGWASTTKEHECPSLLTNYSF